MTFESTISGNLTTPGFMLWWTIQSTAVDDQPQRYEQYNKQRMAEDKEKLLKQLEKLRIEYQGPIFPSISSPG